MIDRPPIDSNDLPSSKRPPAKGPPLRERQIHRGTWLLMFLFGVWTLIIACGSYWFSPVPDIRKPVIVLMAAAIFLLIWIGFGRLSKRR